MNLHILTPSRRVTHYYVAKVLNRLKTGWIEELFRNFHTLISILLFYRTLLYTTTILQDFLENLEEIFPRYYIHSKTTLTIVLSSALLKGNNSNVTTKLVRFDWKR